MVVNARAGKESVAGRRPAGNDAKIVDLPLLTRALLACRSLPKGRGAVSRLLGRLFLSNDTLLKVRMPAGFDMLWTPASVDAVAGAMTVGWDEHVLQTLLRLIEPGDVVYDIGANAGYMSLSAAHRHSDTTIVAIEPLPQLAGALDAAARLNGFDHLSVVQAVLSDADGEMDFFLPAHSIHASLKPREQDARRLTVKAFTMDSLIGAGELPPPDVIKIDVEGAELQLFKGAAETLRTHLPTLVYECDANCARFGTSPSEVAAFLFGLGYTDIMRLRHSSTQGDPVVPGDTAVGDGDFVARAPRPNAQRSNTTSSDHVAHRML